MSGALVVPRDVLEGMSTPAPQPNSEASTPSHADQSSSTAQAVDSEEQALDSHEVIELQTFSERKAWIEEKIKFLEKLPPIEVFVGLDALRDSAEEIPGLPTREQLQQWIEEHDFIEKETEIFDQGELKKLRQITKAATQRNLSPADTDLIELTLTTIYALDKLLHLLRDRSENLDLLGIRLDWEEHRSAAWIERRKIIEDLEVFLPTRAQWSPAVYESTPKVEASPALSRRASLVSLNSDSYSLDNPKYSRSTRFKLAEQLSRDAAQFGARVTNLSHGHVAAAGRLLDKLIDHSRRPVPDILLDEQDRLEDRVINQMENVGKFVLSLVMQWRKADDTYVETLKDQNAAKDLLEEIATAKLNHPTGRQSTQFSTRVDTLLKRLSVRAKPTSKLSGFPKPEHPLFPQQREANESIARFLSSEIETATELVQSAEAAAKEYRESWEAVRRVEAVVKEANELSESFNSIIERLSNGVPAESEDGSPPDLTTSDCLQPNCHSVFLALLPSIQSEASEAAKKATEIVKQSQLAFYGLDNDSVDSIFRSNATESIRQVVALRDQCQALLEATSQRVARLREARQVWKAMDASLKDLQCLRDDIAQLMERDSWKQEAIGHGAPPTPESPAIELSPIAPAPDSTSFEKDLQDIDTKLIETVDLPLQALRPSLEPPLEDCLSAKAHSVRAYHDGLIRMSHMLKTIQAQSSTMSDVRDEYNAILHRVEDARARLSTLTDNVLGYDDSISDIKADEESVQTELNGIRVEASTFADRLSSRVPFVSALGAVSPGRRVLRRSSQSIVETEVGDPLLNLPLDLVALDAAVREDSNTFVMRLRGALESVGKASRQLQVARLAKQVEASIERTATSVKHVEDDLAGLRASMDAAPIDGAEDVALLQKIDTILGKVDVLSECRGDISRSFSPLRDLLRQMDASSHDFEPAVRQSLFTSRLRSLEEVEDRFKSWMQDINSFKDVLLLRRLEEERRLEEARRLAEKRRREEEERRVAEEADRKRKEEEERLKEEERAREEARQAELQRLEEQRLREEEEATERARLLQEAHEEEERRRREEHTRIVADRERETQNLLAQNELDKARLLQERRDVESQLREAEALLREERRLQAERDVLAAERVKYEKSQLEEEAKQQLAAAQAAREELLKADAERIQNAEGEMRRLRRELEFIKTEHKRTLSEREVLSRQQKKSQHKKRPSAIADVFSIGGPSDLRASATDEERQHQSLIYDIRKRLRSLTINELARPSKGKASSSSALPTTEQVSTLRRKFSQLVRDAEQLPDSIANLAVDADLRSLRMELESSEQLLGDIDMLSRLAGLVSKCDTALSDLLEHIDSFPALPLTVSDLHTMDASAPPPEQLSARLAFTRSTIDEMQTIFNSVCNDNRARSERTRVVQTWFELEEMANERLGSGKSRPASVSSMRSGRFSSASVASSAASQRGLSGKKRASYSNLSASTLNVKDGKLAPPGPTPSSSRRVASSAEKQELTSRRSSSRQSLSNSRSVTGPGPIISTGAVGTTPKPFSSSIMGSTFASRQRAGSVTSLGGTPLSNSGRANAGTPVSRARAPSQAGRHRSPSVADAAGRSSSFAVPAPPRTKTTSGSTWSRAPRNSLSSIVSSRTMTPPKPKSVPAGAPRKKYIADPKNKLDVAVGEVVNQLPIGINIEGVAETWRDYSGKYWIGDQDPKLCFCRILRSQTVMVRVGGGWQELSKFIKDHFAESFRLLPADSPPQKQQEEKWISSTTLLEAAEIKTPSSPPQLPSTPEPQVPFVPSFSIMTPNGHSPRSILSSPGSNSGSPGSNLTPMQFMRRADADPALLRPVTPSKTPTGNRPRTQAVAPSAISSVWRP